MNSHVVELIFNLNTQRSNFIHECFRSDEKSVLKIYETQNPHDDLNPIFEKYVFLVEKNQKNVSKTLKTHPMTF